jgi:hypothetical protein
MKQRGVCLLIAVAAAVAAAGCAVRPKPDPRSPAPVRDTPWLLRVCVVEGSGAHLAVGDQVELTTNNLGRLRIRHIPYRNPQRPPAVPWNRGDDVGVKSAVLVEAVDPKGDQTATRRFVPVGRFAVDVGDGGEHERFDFLISKATEDSRGSEFPECNVERGADEVLIRGVRDDGRHDGDVHLRYGP